MNTTVTATGMAVVAENSNGSLLIGKRLDGGAAPTTTSIRAAHTTSVAFTDGTNSLKPSAYTAVPTGNDAPASNITYFGTAGNWFYKTADAATSYASTTSANTLDALTGYVAVYELWICLEAGSNDMANLKVDTVTIQADESTDHVRHATRVVVASADGYEEFYNAHVEGASTNVAAKTTGTEVLAASLTQSSLVPVNVYIYIDGEDEAVYTNNALNLASTTVSITFTAAPV